MGVQGRFESTYGVAWRQEGLRYRGRLGIATCLVGHGRMGVFLEYTSMCVRVSVVYCAYANVCRCHCKFLPKHSMLHGYVP